jgi:hypothetical protein
MGDSAGLRPTSTIADLMEPEMAMHAWRPVGKSGRKVNLHKLTRIWGADSTYIKPASAYHQMPVPACRDGCGSCDDLGCAIGVRLAPFSHQPHHDRGEETRRTPPQRPLARERRSLRGICRRGYLDDRSLREMRAEGDDHPYAERLRIGGSASSCC